MNYSEMVAQLKRTMSDDANATTMVMLLQLMQCLQEHFEKQPNENLNNLAMAANGHLIGSMRQRYSVMRYFSGDGPIAQKLRDYDAISRHFSFGGFKLKQMLESFNFQPVEDEQKQDILRDWLVEVGENAFGVKHQFALPLPYGSGVEAELDTGFHLVAASHAQGAEPERLLVLAADLKGGAKVKYVVRANKEALLLYYHPGEQVWLADNCSVYLDGTQEALAVEWEKLANAAGYTAAPVDTEANLKEIEEKVNFIFDNEEMLPHARQFYTRDKDHSYLRFALEEYVLLFINTKGKYPSRTTLLQINQGPAFSSKVEWSQMREFARQELLKITQMGLNEIIGEHLGEIIPVSAESEPEPVVQKHAQPRPFHNPVFLATLGKAEKK